MREGTDITGDKELHLDIDVVEVSDGRPVGRLTLKFTESLASKETLGDD
jgi:hypothetical protein